MATVLLFVCFSALLMISVGSSFLTSNISPRFANPDDVFATERSVLRSDRRRLQPRHFDPTSREYLLATTPPMSVIYEKGNLLFPHAIFYGLMDMVSKLMNRYVDQKQNFMDGYIYNKYPQRVERIIYSPYWPITRFTRTNILGFNQRSNISITGYSNSYQKYKMRVMQSISTGFSEMHLFALMRHYFDVIVYNNMPMTKIQSPFTTLKGRTKIINCLRFYGPFYHQVFPSAYHPVELIMLPIWEGLQVAILYTNPGNYESMLNEYRNGSYRDSMLGEHPGVPMSVVLPYTNILGQEPSNNIKIDRSTWEAVLNHASSDQEWSDQVRRIKRSSQVGVYIQPFSLNVVPHSKFELRDEIINNVTISFPYIMSMISKGSPGDKVELATLYITEGPNGVDT